MPEFQSPPSAETRICANIQKLTAQLNGELEAAHELGLKVSVSSRGQYLMVDSAERVSVRVWREIELLREPPSEPHTFLDIVRANAQLPESEAKMK